MGRSGALRAPRAPYPAPLTMLYFSKRSEDDAFKGSGFGDRDSSQRYSKAQHQWYRAV